MSQGSVDELMREPASDLLCRFQGEVLNFLRKYFYSFALGNFHMKNCFLAECYLWYVPWWAPPSASIALKINWLKFCLHEPLHVPHSPTTISLGRLKNKDKQSNVKLYTPI